MSQLQFMLPTLYPRLQDTTIQPITDNAHAQCTILAALPSSLQHVLLVDVKSIDNCAHAHC